MKLNKKHREALLAELEQTREEKINREFVINNKKDNNFDDWNEIKMFLITSKIELIEKSLINNEIDF